jgi:hypothetical protein
MTNHVLRTIAILIAAAGLVDPAVPMSGAARPRLAVVTIDPPSSADVLARDRLIADLAPWFEILPNITSDAAAAVVIGDRSPDEAPAETLLVSTITTERFAPPIVRIVRAHAPREVPPSTAIRIEAEVEGLGVAATSSDLTARIAGLEVARATRRWVSDRERWHAVLDAVPVGQPPWAVRLDVVPTGSTTIDSRAGQTLDVVVGLRRSPLRVEFYEPRPSWASTFVRRALEADARFEVAAISFSSRGIAARTGDAAAPGEPRLDNADVVVAGGLDRLSAHDTRALDRFMRERGGAVVLVPDARIDRGSAYDLLSQSGRIRADMTERLLERPATLSMAAGVASLQASELVVFDAPAPGTDIVATTGGAEPDPVAVSMPVGSGRLFVSGAMDAWRFRAADNRAFDRFWQSTIAALALAVPPPIELSIEPAIVRPLGRGEITVRVRSGEYAPLTATIDDQFIRLRPEPDAGVFRGTFTAKAVAGRSTVDVRAGGGAQPAVSRTLLVVADAQPPEAAPPLAMLASARRGIAVTPERIADLERFLRDAVPSSRANVVRHPMRSAWWLLPFAACLSGEWWRRRRRGLR